MRKILMSFFVFKYVCMYILFIQFAYVHIHILAETDIDIAI